MVVTYAMINTNYKISYGMVETCLVMCDQVMAYDCVPQLTPMITPRNSVSDNIQCQPALVKQCLVYNEHVICRCSGCS